MCVCVRENMGKLGNTRSGYRRKSMSDCSWTLYNMTFSNKQRERQRESSKMQISLSLSLRPSLIAKTQLWFNTQPVHGAFSSTLQLLFQTHNVWSVLSQGEKKKKVYWLTDSDAIYFSRLKNELWWSSPWLRRERERERGETPSFSQKNRTLPV